MKPPSCQGCVLERTGIGWVPADGAGTNGILLVGEAPGEQEARSGKPFQGQSGVLLDRILKRAGLDRAHFRVHNVLSCRPPGNELVGRSWQTAVIDHCAPNLDATIAQMRPKVIVALGATALTRLTGETGIERMRGWPLPLRGNPSVWVVPTYHPSFLLPRAGQKDTTKLTGAVILDIKKAVAIAQQGFAREASLRYALDPTPAMAGEWASTFEAALANDPTLSLAWDIETVGKLRGTVEDELELDHSSIIRVGFAWERGAALSVPWRAEYMGVIRRLLEKNPARKIGWNCFHRNTSVLMADGTWRPIWQVAKGDVVQSLTSFGERTTAKVQGTLRRPARGEWLRVSVDGAYARGGSRWGQDGVVCTPDHVWYTSTGPKRADELTVNDRVWLARPGHDQVVEGCILGDGHVTPEGALRIGHTNEAWLRAKAEHLGSPIQGPRRNSSGYGDSLFWTSELPVGRDWRQRYYGKTGRRWHPPTSRALAIWYQDDGWLNKGRTASFAIHRYRGQAAEILGWFRKEFGVDVVVDHDEVLRLNTRASQKFFARIGMLIHTANRYKVPEEADPYNGWMECVRSVRSGRVVAVMPETRRDKAAASEYCLTVEGTHRFFTRHGLVANCWGFDLVQVRRAGVYPAGPQFDAMWGWHYLQSDLPKGLETVASHYAAELGPWKHISAAEPARYNAFDADSQLRCGLGIERDLQAAGLWDIFTKHSLELSPLLYEAGRVRGVRIDKVAQGALREQIDADYRRLVCDVQERVPVELRKVKQSAKRPVDVRVVEVLVDQRKQVCTKCGKKPAKSHFWAGKPCHGASLVEQVVPKPRYQWDPEWRAVPDNETLEKWVQAAGFNAVSPKQMSDYIRFHKHKMGANPKTGMPSVDKLALEGLARRFPDAIYSLVLELKALVKTRGTYLYEPDALGKIYTTYTETPSSLRLSSRNPNLQNVTHRSDNRYADTIRRTIVPPPGQLFVEADSTAIEAVLVGLFMENPDYIAKARRGIHAWLCTKILDWDPTPEHYAKVKKAEPVLYDRVKRVVHMSNYMGTPRLIAQIYPRSFPTEADAAKLQKTYLESCPGLAEWQHRVCEIAHRQAFLRNAWGYRHFFWEVFTWNARKQAIVYGNDAKRAVSFLPQSSAAAFMKDTLRLLGASRWRQHLGANCSVHDSVCLMVDEKDVDLAVEELAAVMTRAVPELDGLRIGCEVKVGENWADMSSVKVVIP